MMAIVHIDDAVAATAAALTAEPGVYNIVDDDPLPVAEWLPAFAQWVNAPEPPRLSVDNALKIAGEEAVHFHTSLSEVARAKAKLGFNPRPLLRKDSRTSTAAALEPGGNNVERIDIMSQPVNDDAIDFFEIDQDITLRRMVLRNSNPKGTVLFLHGFPETLYAWKDIAKALADEYEVHAFDWPGYGLSSRPTVDRFSYAPKDYARILDRYFGKAGIDTSKLTIYATDIGALPTLLLAVERPDIARTIIVGDFAPFNRPQFMYASLQSLKEGPAMDQVRANLNSNRDEILQNTFTRGLPEEEHFEVAREFKDDMFRGWTQGAMTSADAFSHYYSHFTRDQDHFESQLARLKTPVKVVWGEKDLYINKEMGVEFAERVRAKLTLLPGIGHFPHLQNPMLAIDEVRDAFR